jgi:hypothetical protein
MGPARGLTGSKKACTRGVWVGKACSSQRCRRSPQGPTTPNWKRQQRSAKCGVLEPSVKEGRGQRPGKARPTSPHLRFSSVAPQAKPQRLNWVSDAGL